MGSYLIAAIVVLLLVFFVLGYLWLVRPRQSANFRAYQEISRKGARDYQMKSATRGGSEWQERREWR